MVPSLFVIFISGWGSGTEKRDNLFYSNNPFLEQVLSVYPAAMLKSESANSSYLDIYTKLGGVVGANSLSHILTENNIRQKKVASPDRFGLLSESFTGTDISSEKEDWKLINYPHGESLQITPELEVPKIMKELEASLKYKRDAVVFASISQLWALGLYKDKTLLKNGVQYLSKSLGSFIEKAVHEGVRVLLVSDSSLCESYQEVFDNDLLTKTEAPLPCVLIHSAVDGLRASDNDYASDNITHLSTSGSLSDIPATILSLMKIDQPDWLKGDNLFPKLTDRTL